MAKSANQFNQSCYSSCDAAYKACMSTKEHTSVCKMKRAQCSCSCIME